jgi:hypothetical protein
MSSAYNQQPIFPYTAFTEWCSFLMEPHCVLCELQNEFLYVHNTLHIHGYWEPCHRGRPGSSPAVNVGFVVGKVALAHVLRVLRCTRHCDSTIVYYRVIFFSKTSCATCFWGEKKYIYLFIYARSIQK